MGPQPLRVLIVDDNPEIRAGLRGLLKQLGALIVGEAEDGCAGIEQAQSLQPELIVLDVSMPVMGGLAVARKLRDLMPEVHIIFVSQHTERAYTDEALRAGASGYVVKRTAGLDLPDAINVVVSGGIFVSPSTRGPKPAA